MAVSFVACECCVWFLWFVFLLWRETMHGSEMESRPGFVSAAIRHVPQRGWQTPAALSSASSQTTHLAAALEGHQAGVGMGLFTQLV